MARGACAEPENLPDGRYPARTHCLNERGRVGLRTECFFIAGGEAGAPGLATARSFAPDASVNDRRIRMPVHTEEHPPASTTRFSDGFHMRKNVGSRVACHVRTPVCISPAFRKAFRTEGVGNVLSRKMSIIRWVLTGSNPRHSPCKRHKPVFRRPLVNA